MFRKFLLASSLGLAATTMVAVPPASAVPFSDWKTVSSGVTYACAIRVGTLWCWGGNFFGQQGNGTSGNTFTTVPTQVGTDTDWKTVDAGGYHACAIKVSGALLCWGVNSNGRTGNGATAGNQTSPLAVGEATGWTSVSASASGHTCGIRSPGKLYCWGFDGNGQLGNGEGSADVTEPQQTGDKTDWKRVITGDSHTCGIRGGTGVNKLFCWGEDDGSQVGNGPASNAIVPSPQQVGTATNWKQVSGGLAHTCGIRGGAGVNKLYCWGTDADGQVGNGPASTANVPAPQLIGAATTWHKISAGYGHTCGIRGGDGASKLYCWGLDSDGQVGNGPASSADVEAPEQIGSKTNWTVVSTGFLSSCGIRGTGLLHTWGSDTEGVLGNGDVTTNDVPSPQVI